MQTIKWKGIWSTASRTAWCPTSTVNPRCCTLVYNKIPLGGLSCFVHKHYQRPLRRSNCRCRCLPVCGAAEHSTVVLAYACWTTKAWVQQANGPDGPAHRLEAGLAGRHYLGPLLPENAQLYTTTAIILKRAFTWLRTHCGRGVTPGNT